MINILKIFGKLDSGGAELRTLDLITGINERGINKFKFHILVLRGEKGTLDDDFINQNVKIHYIKLKEFKFISNFIKLIKRERIEVLYSNVFLFSGVFMFIGKVLNIPVRISHIRTLFDERENGLRRIRNFFLKRLMYFNATDIIGVNSSVLSRNFPNYLRKDKFKVLYNGIRSSAKHRESYLDLDRVNIVHIGRQTHAKNHEKLISTFIEINRILPNAHLHLIGKIETNINNKIKKIIKENKLDNNVIVWDVQRDISSFLNGKNLLLFPSVREGLPGVILEALAYGVPVLASNIEPHLELEKYFASLTTLDLNSSDKEWAEVAVKIINEFPILNSEKIIEEFTESPFSLEEHVNEYLEIICNSYERNT